MEDNVEEDCNIWRDFGIKEAIKHFKEKGQWTENFGDRNSEFVCIGIKLDKDKLMEALKAALLTDEEFFKGRESWQELDDPMFDGVKLWDLKDLNAVGQEREEFDDEDREDDDCEKVSESCENMSLSNGKVCQESNETDAAKIRVGA